MSSKLSIFIDESGDFGAYEAHSPYYLFSLVFHDQSKPIHDQAQKLEERMIYSPFSTSHCFHTMPIIRREGDYRDLEVPERRKLLGYLLAFMRSCPISYTTVLVEKKKETDVVSLTSALTRGLANFIVANLAFFRKYDQVIVYYDNGQIELTKVLVAVFNSLVPFVEFRKVQPSQYRLFQVADLCCTMELIAYKQQHAQLSKSEIAFFGNTRDMNRNYLKPVFSKRLNDGK